jgi:hypothetical protein
MTEAMQQQLKTGLEGLIAQGGPMAALEAILLTLLVWARAAADPKISVAEQTDEVVRVRAYLTEDENDPRHIQWEGPATMWTEAVAIATASQAQPAQPAGS